MGSKLVTGCDIVHLCPHSAFPESTSCSKAQAVGQAAGKASKATYYAQVRYEGGVPPPSPSPLQLRVGLSLHLSVPAEPKGLNSGPARKLAASSAQAFSPTTGKGSV